MQSEQILGIGQKINRAEKHIADFRVQLSTFTGTDPYAIHIDVDTDPAQPTVHVLKADPIPPELLCIVGDAIHNLRSALDHLACALVIANRQKVTNQVEFPILDGPITTPKLETRFATKVHGMRKEAIDAIRNIHPYQGGNNTLWRLHRLDAIDKHNVLLAGFGNITAINGYPLIADQWNGNRWAHFGELAVLKEGQQFQFLDTKIDKDTKFFSEVVFNQPDVAEGYPVILALSQFRREVLKVINALRFWALG